jgi:hypothetical protein
MIITDGGLVVFIYLAQVNEVTMVHAIAILRFAKEGHKSLTVNVRRR